MKKTRKYQYDTIDEDGNNLTITITDSEILESFYPYWYSRVIKKYSAEELQKVDLEECCIRDFLVNNWAWEIE